jgi:hypothetical protein
VHQRKSRLKKAGFSLAIFLLYTFIMKLKIITAIIFGLLGASISHFFFSQKVTTCGGYSSSVSFLFGTVLHENREATHYSSGCVGGSVETKNGWPFTSNSESPGCGCIAPEYLQNETSGSTLQPLGLVGNFMVYFGAVVLIALTTSLKSKPKSTK